MMRYVNTHTTNFAGGRDSRPSGPGARDTVAVIDVRQGPTRPGCILVDSTVQSSPWRPLKVFHSLTVFHSQAGASLGGSGDRHGKAIRALAHASRKSTGKGGMI